MMRHSILLAFATLILIPTGSVARDHENLGEAIFSSVERKLIRDYYQANYGHHDVMDAPRPDKKAGKTPGKNKANSKKLPPGIAKKLARGGTLPPGIAKRQLPNDLEQRLPPVRTGYRRMEVDGQVVLVDIASDVIVDVIYDLARAVTNTP